MIIDARTGERNWQVFDVPRCAIVSHVVWVDTDRAVWAGWHTPPADIVLWEAWRDNTFPLHQERCITVVPEQRMVLLNPWRDVSDDEMADLLLDDISSSLGRAFERFDFVRGTGCTR